MKKRQMLIIEDYLYPIHLATFGFAISGTIFFMVLTLDYRWFLLTIIASIAFVWQSAEYQLSEMELARDIGRLLSDHINKSNGAHLTYDFSTKTGYIVILDKETNIGYTIKAGLAKAYYRSLSTPVKGVVKLSASGYSLLKKQKIEDSLQKAGFKSWHK